MVSMGVSGLPTGTYAWPAPLTQEANDTNVWSADPPPPNGMDDSTKKFCAHITLVFIVIAFMVVVCWAMFWVAGCIKRCYETLARVTKWCIAVSFLCFMWGLFWVIFEELDDLEVQHGTSTPLFWSWPPAVDAAFDDFRDGVLHLHSLCLLYTSPSPRDRQKSRMPSSA